MTSNISRPFLYTNRDFDSLREDLRRRLAVAIPEWTTYDAGFESLLLDMYAYVGDIENFYIDRMGNEAFLQNAVLRESVLNIAAMFGYTPGAQTAAGCTLQFTKTAAALGELVTVLAGTVLFAQTEGQRPVYFETVVDLAIPPATASLTTPGIEGRTILKEQLGTSIGGANQSFVLFNNSVIRDSVRVYTRDGSISATDTEWRYTPRLIDASPFDRSYSLYVDQDNFTFVVFGDGVSGVVPSAGVLVVATYRYGVGAAGNVGIGAVKSFVAGGLVTSKIMAVTNTTAASGGTDPESIEAMRLSIPRSLTTLERAVTLTDYAALALNVAGVVKTSATAVTSTSVTVYVAPAGGGQPSTNMITLLNAYFTGPPSRAMIGTSVSFIGPTYVPINITVSLTVNAKHRRDTVVLAVTAAITALFSFNNRLFNELISKAMVFREIVDIDGVDYVDITTFSRTTGTADVQLAVNEIATLGTLTINPTGGVVLA